MRELARSILSRPEYSDREPNARLVEWLNRLLEWLGKLDALRVSSPALYWSILGGVVLLLVLLVAHVVWALRTALGASEPAADTALEGAPPPDLAADAERLAADGRHLEAAHRLMIASFRRLGEAAVIELRPDRSNRWIRDALHRSRLEAGLATEIAVLVESTEQRWFGDRADDPRIYLRWRDAFTRLAGTVRS